MRNIPKRNIILLIASAVAMFTACYGGTGDVQFVESFYDNFDARKDGRIHNQGAWRAETWRAGNLSHEVIAAKGIDGKEGKALAVKANNGFHNRIYLTPRLSGTTQAQFDFLPVDGLVTVVGFKAENAAWNQFQGSIVLYPEHSGGGIGTVKGGKNEMLQSNVLKSGKWYRVFIDVTPHGDPFDTDSGTGTYRIRIDSEGRTLFQSEALPFDAAANAAVGLFEVRSLIWNKPVGPYNGLIDNLRIESNPAEPVLAVRSASFGHLFKMGENVTVRGMVRARGESLTGSADLTVFDPYGEVVFKGQQPFAVGANIEREISWDVPADNLKKYGLYHTRLSVGENNHQFVYSTFGVIAPPRNVGDNSDSPFGAFLYPLDGVLYPEFAPHMPAAVRQMYDLGIRWVRCNFHWNNIEKEQGKFEWGRMGDLVDEIYRHGDMHAFIEVANTPLWASSSQSATGGSIDTGVNWSTVAPRDFADWENFCRVTAERYKGRVKVYEIWNEPGAPRDGNSNGFWRDSSDNFVKVIQHGSQAIRSVDPEAKIMVSGFRAVDMGKHFENFVERVLSQVIEDIDIVSFHYWGRGAWTPKVYDLQRLFREYGRIVPYWDTEAAGSGTSADIVKDFLWTWSMGAEKVFPFIFNLPRYPDKSLVNPDYTPTAGTMSFATMTRLLTGMKPEGQVNPGPGVRGFSFSDDKTRIIVAWHEVEGKETMPATLSGITHALDHFGNPIGDATAGSYQRNTIEVGPHPTYIFSNFDSLDPFAK